MATRIAQPAAAPTNPKKGLAITAVVLGIVSFLAMLAGPFNFLVAILGIAFGIIAVVKNQSKGMSIAGTILASIAFIGSVSITTFFYVPIIQGIFSGQAINQTVNLNDGRIPSSEILLVGQDIDAGQYRVLQTDDQRYLDAQVYTMLTVGRELGDDGLITSESTTYSNSDFYADIITVKNGDYLEVIAGILYPIDAAPSLSLEEQDREEKILFAVGKDIPAGSYKAENIDPEGAGGRYRVLSSTVPEETYMDWADPAYIEGTAAPLTGVVKSIVPKYDPDEPLDLQEGQYIELSGVRITQL